MQKDEAIMILSRHLMQCGMLMPIEWVQSNGDGSEFMQAFEMAMDALKNEPVRCKDCEHWKKGEFKGGDTKENLEWGGSCALSRFARYESDFCSYGERRTVSEDGK